ncbi:hypothetical protein BC828DRAFT_401666 [Blastocladiella britannica]|nr:hypothetical protein BC828DRAFT_401666 [Blastocladiella britannica]
MPNRHQDSRDMGGKNGEDELATAFQRMRTVASAPSLLPPSASASDGGHGQHHHHHHRHHHHEHQQQQPYSQALPPLPPPPTEPTAARGSLPDTIPIPSSSSLSSHASLSSAHASSMTASSASSIHASSTSSRHTAHRHKKPVRSDRAKPNTNKTAAPLPLNRAMLSRLGAAFRARIHLGTHERDGITYPQSFIGRDGVDVIARLLRSPDRNLALLVGRALDAQRFFHHVTYTHRLRDSESEVYVFAHAMDASVAARAATGGTGLSQSSPPSQHNSSGAPSLPNGFFTLLSECYSPTCTTEQLCYSTLCPRQVAQRAYLGLPQAPGDQSLDPFPMTAAAVAAGDGDDHAGMRGWADMVPEHVRMSIAHDERELRRQESIFEMIVSEESYVEDMCLVKDLFMDSILRDGLIARGERAREFVQVVFGNLLEVRDAAKRFAGALVRRQQERYIVQRIGDVILGMLPVLFAPLTKYAGLHPWGKFVLDAETAVNPALAKFLRDAERAPGARRLPIQSFLGRPISRAARYSLLIRSIAKQTPPDHPDQADFTAALDMLHELLSGINSAAGKADTAVRLQQLHQAFVYSNEDETLDLGLLNRDRELIREGTLRRSGSSGEEMQLLLLDHVLLIARRKRTKQDQSAGIEFRSYRPAIPLPLVHIDIPDEGLPVPTRAITPTPMDTIRSRSGSSASGLTQRTSTGNLSTTTTTSTPTAAAAATLASKSPSRKGSVATIVTHPHLNASTHSLPAFESSESLLYPSGGRGSRTEFPFTITRLGHSAFSLTLLANSMAERKEWVAAIRREQAVRSAPTRRFRPVIVPESVQLDVMVTCATTVHTAEGSWTLVGTDRGVHALGGGTLRYLLALEKVQQLAPIDGDGGSVLALVADKTLYAVPLAAVVHCILANGAMPRPKKISTGVTFVRVGSHTPPELGGLSRPILCAVKPTGLSSTTFKLYEPALVRRKHGGSTTSALARFFRPSSSVSALDTSPAGSSSSAANAAASGDGDPLRLIRELYVPSEAASVAMIDGRLVVGCGPGFEMLDIDGHDHRTLLDTTDPALEFLQDASPSGTRAMAIFVVPTSGTSLAPSRRGGASSSRSGTSGGSGGGSGDGALYLLCYSQFAVLVTRGGQRARPDWWIEWDGEPRAFAFDYPYVIGYSPRMMEVWHIGTAARVQVVSPGPDASLMVLDAPRLTMAVSGPGAVAAVMQQHGGIPPADNAQAATWNRPLALVRFERLDAAAIISLP